MRDAPDAVMLFAAGFGTRMGALTASRPKPLIKVAGKPLLDHALDLVAGYGPARTVVNTHYLSDQVAMHLAGRDIHISDEQPDILETGGGLRNALPLLGDDPVFTMNTDAVWAGPNPFAQLAAAWDPAQMDALLLCIPPDNAIGHTGPGDFVTDATGRASRGPGAVYSGLQILKTDGLGSIPEPAFSLNILWNRMLNAGRLHAVTYPGKWCDVGTPEGIALAESMLRDANV
ncbi:Glucose-1-phosphate cytidylyltransferase [Roseovarius sp. THAF9]|uniref:nucleotidyltransferase family protein n=1 Tax=Roseovarius sp. THAF9 TaxID=2587847 RepID=UPI001268661E|nr:nucleotidyltransferase family protein [Roseovarius sp. THAF9]QFT94956.1 Glucose-1-phosphate cytidylyltransferase [Roseovarius sp. THAF9]